MKGITSEVIAEVRSRANIIDLISESVVLKRAGKDYKGLCPFHKEKTPSFHVSAEKGIYKCFGCGEGGDIFAFVQKIKGLDFLDTVRDLAERFGIALVETAEDRRAFDKRSLMLMLHEQACQYYVRLLEHPSEGLVAREYLENRGVSPEIIKKFRLGYAPSGWDGLLRHLTEANQVAPTTLEEAGLIRRRNDGSNYFDLFRHRLIIPICDDQGRVIAFGGRTLGNDQVKYLNSPETPLYTKGLNLFAFNLAKDSIKTKDAVLLVEGYFDAITAHQFGFNNTVATLGTALTMQQAKMLVRFTESKRVYLSFDSDAAGAKAVERGVETLHEVSEGVGIELRVIDVPGGKDPDECLHSANGLALFEQAIAEAPLLIDHQINSVLAKVGFETHTGKIEAAKLVVPILANIRNAVARGEYIRQAAMRIGVREEELLSDVGEYRREHRLVRPPDRPNANLGSHRARLPEGTALNFQVKNSVGSKRHFGSASREGTAEAERRLLALFLTSREDHQIALNSLLDEQLISAEHRLIKEAIGGVGTSFNNCEDLEHKLMDRLAPNKEASAALIEVILTADEMRKQDAPAELIIREARARLIKERLNQLITGLRGNSASTNEESDSMHVQSKIAELTKLERIVLPNISEISELDDLQRKINQLVGQPQNSFSTETRV